MKRFCPITLFLALVFNFSLNAYQNETVVAWINDEPVYSGEFLYAFNKNRNQDSPISPDSLSNYLDQFLNFRLKVLAGKNTGMDTTQKFLQEFDSYTSEIRKPYLQNPNAEEDLIQEAYSRLQLEVRAAHILVRIPKNATPKDTLSAYNKIQAIRQRALNGEDFGELAKKNSEDGSAQLGGDLGYFTGFSMVYPFETAAFRTETGQVSEIARTQFGYHILKVLDKRPARGRVKAAHVFISGSNKTAAQARNLIQQAYDSLQNGGDWRAICVTYSEDNKSKNSGGSLPFYGVAQFPEPLLNAAFSLEKPGEYTSPLKSQFGWHILKLEAKEAIKPLDELKLDLTNRIRQSGRNQLDKKGILKKLKAENGFRQSKLAIDTTVSRMMRFDSSEVIPRLPPLFVIGEKEIHYADFKNYIQNKTKSTINLPEQYIWTLYSQFEYDEVIAYEESQLPNKYPEHQYLINEYRDGLLLFEIMEHQVWNKAIEDTTGLKAYFQENQKKYPAKERIDALLFESDSVDLLKKIIEMPENISDSEELNNLLKNNLGPDVYALLKIVKRRFEQDDLPTFAEKRWESGRMVPDLNRFKLYWIEKIIPAGFYELDEIKGRVISDYQDFLDQKWIKKLRNENEVKINKKAIRSIIKTLD